MKISVFPLNWCLEDKRGLNSYKFSPKITLREARVNIALLWCLQEQIKLHKHAGPAKFCLTEELPHAPILVKTERKLL